MFRIMRITKYRPYTTINALKNITIQETINAFTIYQYFGRFGNNIYTYLKSELT